MHNKILLASLAMDLKRVALGYNRGSVTMAKRFSEEALRRKKEIYDKDLKPYMQKLLISLPLVLEEGNKEKLAENAQMYSTLIQNYALKFV